MTQEIMGWRRYLVVFGGMLLTGALCSPALATAVSSQGTIGPTVLQAESPAIAVIVTVICFGLATGIACIAGRLINAVVGLFVLGCGVAVLSLRFGSIRDLAFAQGSVGMMIVETAMWTVLILGATVAVFRVSGPLADFGTREKGDDVVVRFGLKGVAASLLMLPAVWLIARSDLKGQTLAAVTLGAMMVGLLVRPLSPKAQPLLAFAAPCLVGALGMLIGLVLLDGTLADAFVGRSMPALLYPMPVDYAAGSLLGIALGLGWARSFQPEGQPAATNGTTS